MPLGVLSLIMNPRGLYFVYLPIISMIFEWDQKDPLLDEKIKYYEAS